ncbi:MAG: hypothetical protein LBN27_06900 [Prevotellaceae bacterium]|jgi:hypothetical protein|nr:hypothetical protein [Prevotellaceae bacterium]
MKTNIFKVLFCCILMATVFACKDKNSEPNTTSKSLVGKWGIENHVGTWLEITDNEIISYPKSSELSDSRISYKWISQDSIEIAIPLLPATHNKVIFYSKDSVLVEGLMTSLFTVFPTDCYSAVLTRITEETIKVSYINNTGKTLKNVMANGVNIGNISAGGQSGFISYDKFTVDGSPYLPVISFSGVVNNDTLQYLQRSWCGTMWRNLTPGKYTYSIEYDTDFDDKPGLNLVYQQ